MANEDAFKVGVYHCCSVQSVLTVTFLCLWQELVEMVKAKKAAQEQVAAKSKK